MQDSIYRFMSFFELYELLINKKLKFTKIALMDDKNELLGDGILNQLNIYINPLGQTNEKMRESIEHKKAYTYISCWTKESDLMAMWLLYSKNKDAIRVKTSIDKLKKCSNEFASKNYFPKHVDSTIGTIQTNLPTSEIAEVEYINYEVLYNMVKNEKIKLLNALGNAHEEKSDILSTIMDKHEEEVAKICHKGKYLKDEVFSYENEVRSVLRLSKRNNRSSEEYKEKLKEYREKDFLSIPMITCNIVDDEFEMPNITYIPIDLDFIEEITFDQRMPQYQQDIYKEILNLNNDSRVVLSNAFGIKTEEFDFGLDLEKLTNMPLPIEK